YWQVIDFFLTATAATEISTFPYTTLFRSDENCRSRAVWNGHRRSSGIGRGCGTLSTETHYHGGPLPRRRPHRHCGQACQSKAVRSEEHTSELQSRENLVCRLLLEKKKK